MRSVDVWPVNKSNQQMWITAPPRDDACLSVMQQSGSGITPAPPRRKDPNGKNDE